MPVALKLKSPIDDEVSGVTTWEDIVSSVIDAPTARSPKCVLRQLK